MHKIWLLLAITSIIAVAIKLLPWFPQDNTFVITMLLPFNLLMDAAFHRSR